MKIARFLYDDGQLLLDFLFEKILFLAIFRLKKCEQMLYLRCKKEN